MKKKKKKEKKRLNTVKEKNDTGHRGEARRLRNVTNGAERTEKQSGEKLKLGSLVISILSVGVSNTKSFPKVSVQISTRPFFPMFPIST